MNDKELNDSLFLRLKLAVIGGLWRIGKYR
jgi:hypothetical protein